MVKFTLHQRMAKPTDSHVHIAWVPGVSRKKSDVTLFTNGEM